MKYVCTHFTPTRTVNAEESTYTQHQPKCHDNEYPHNQYQYLLWAMIATATISPTARTLTAIGSNELTTILIIIN